MPSLPGNCNRKFVENRRIASGTASDKITPPGEFQPRTGKQRTAVVTPEKNISIFSQCMFKSVSGNQPHRIADHPIPEARRHFRTVSIDAQRGAVKDNKILRSFDQTDSGDEQITAVDVKKFCQCFMGVLQKTKSRRAMNKIYLIHPPQRRLQFGMKIQLL